MIVLMCFCYRRVTFHLKGVDALQSKPCLYKNSEGIKGKRNFKKTFSVYVAVAGKSWKRRVQSGSNQQP